MQTERVDTQSDAANPLISFIIPYHNEPLAMLEACVKSVLSLSLQPNEREIIVVDDGSEISPMACLTALDKHIICISQANAGVSVARNKGLEISRGMYVQFVDADDKLVKPQYDHCIHLIKRGKIDAVLFRFTINESQTNYTDSSIVDGITYVERNNIRSSVWSYLFRKECSKNLRFSQGIAYGEDEEFTPQLLLKCNSVIETTAEAYYYRQHEASVLHQKSKERIRKRLDDNLKVILHLHRLELPNTKKRALRRRVAQLTMDLIYNTMVLTRNYATTTQYIEQLKEQGLFPLPQRNYTKKYSVFSRLVNHNVSRRLLFVLLKTRQG